MQKVYLLLRNNQQTGPYSLEELSQLQLKNTDLIWIEGKSAGWYYPYELQDIKPIFDKTMALKKPQSPPVKPVIKQETSHVPQTAEKTTKSAVPPKKIYVSMPNVGVTANAPVAELKEVVPESKPAETKKVDEIEQRAEDLRRRIQAYPAMKEQAKAAAIQPKEEEKKKEAAPTPLAYYELDEVPTYAKQSNPPVEQEPGLKHRLVKEKHTSDNIQDLYDSTPNLTGNKRRNTSSPILQYAAVIFMLALLVGAGWWMYRSFSSKEQQNDSNSEQVANPVQQTTVPLTSPADQANTAATNQLGDTSISSGAAKASAAVISGTTTNKIKQLPVKPGREVLPLSAENTSITDKQAANAAPMQTSTPTTEKANVPPVVAVKKDNTTADGPNAVPAEDQAQKKEGFFSKLFKKKNKEESAPSDATSTNAEGERNTTKRDATPTAPTPALETNITDQVQVSLNTPEDKWMMGVSGLRLTMTNSSNADLKRAAVDVIYYNDQNDVIQRKTVYFTNIRPGKSRSVAAPDHKTADHAGYKIVSAVGIQK